MYIKSFEYFSSYEVTQMNTQIRGNKQEGWNPEFSERKKKI